QQQHDDERHAKVDQRRKDGGQRHRHAREVHLGNQVRVSNQADAALGQRAVKRRVAQQSGEGEEERRQSAGRHVADDAEDDRENPRQQQRLKHHPYHAQGRLAITQLDVAGGQRQQQIAKLPQLVQIQRRPSLRWTDDQIRFARARESGFHYKLLTLRQLRWF